MYLLMLGELRNGLNDATVNIGNPNIGIYGTSNSDDAINMPTVNGRNSSYPPRMHIALDTLCFLTTNIW